MILKIFTSCEVDVDRSPIVSTVANTAKPPEIILVNEWINVCMSEWLF